MSAQLHLSELHTCGRCGQRLVLEWLAYWFGPDAPRHASCEQFARAITEDPERFQMPKGGEPR